MSEIIPLHMFIKVKGHELVLPSGFPLDIFNESVKGCNYFPSAGFSRTGETKYTDTEPKRLVPADEGFRWISFYNQNKANAPLLGSRDRDAKEEYADYISYDGKTLQISEGDKQFLQLEKKALVLGDCVNMRIFNPDNFEKYEAYLKRWNELSLFRQTKPITHSHLIRNNLTTH